MRTFQELELALNPSIEIRLHRGIGDVIDASLYHLDEVTAQGDDCIVSSEGTTIYEALTALAHKLRKEDSSDDR